MDEDKKLLESDQSNLAKSDTLPGGEVKSNEFTPQYEPQNKSSKKIIYIAGLGIIVLLVAGFLILNRNVSKQEKTKVTPDQTSTPTPAPTPSPQSTLIRSEWSLEVLNGTGVTGAAKKVADKLKELGYQIVKTGNADRDDYLNSQILVKENLMDKADLVISDLKDVVRIASVGGELEDSTASARIILGKD